jgi:hypothetical protein
MNKLFLLAIFHFLTLREINGQFEEISQKIDTSCLTDNIILLPPSNEYILENKHIEICSNTTLQSVDNLKKSVLHMKNSFFKIKKSAVLDIRSMSIKFDDAVLSLKHFFFLTESSSLIINVRK